MNFKYLLFHLIVLIFLFGCEKWTLERESFPQINTGNFEAGITPSIGILHGEITNLLSNDFVEHYGHVWSTGFLAKFARLRSPERSHVPCRHRPHT